MVSEKNDHDDDTPPEISAGEIKNGRHASSPSLCDSDGGAGPQYGVPVQS